MKIISSKVHGVLDYATVVFLLLSPALFNMEGNLATFTYILGVVHFLLTLFTAFELGMVKVIPFRIHGLIEIAVAVILTGAAFWFFNQGNNTGLYFYLILAAVILVEFILTDFTYAK